MGNFLLLRNLKSLIYNSVAELRITYSYNLVGQLEKVHGYKSYGYDYVSKIDYDKFEQRTYLKYCNGAETFSNTVPTAPMPSKRSISAARSSTARFISNCYWWSKIIANFCRK